MCGNNKLHSRRGPRWNPLYRRAYLLSPLATPVVPGERRFDPAGDVWLYYNLCTNPARIHKVDAPLAAAGVHTEQRYSHHWEKLGVAALGKGVSGTDRPCKSGDKSGNGEMAQNRILKLKHPSTHKFPDYPDFGGFRRLPWRPGFDAVQIGPQYGGDAPGFP